MTLNCTWIYVSVVDLHHSKVTKPFPVEALIWAIQAVVTDLGVTGGFGLSRDTDVREHGEMQIPAKLQFNSEV